MEASPEREPCLDNPSSTDADRPDPEAVTNPDESKSTSQDHDEGDESDVQELCGQFRDKIREDCLQFRSLISSVPAVILTRSRDLTTNLRSIGSRLQSTVRGIKTITRKQTVKNTEQEATHRNASDNLDISRLILYLGNSIIPLFSIVACLVVFQLVASDAGSSGGDQTWWKSPSTNSVPVADVHKHPLPPDLGTQFSVDRSEDEVMEGFLHCADYRFGPECQAHLALHLAYVPLRSYMHLTRQRSSHLIRPWFNHHVKQLQAALRRPYTPDGSTPPDRLDVSQVYTLKLAFGEELETAFDKLTKLMTKSILEGKATRLLGLPEVTYDLHGNLDGKCAHSEDWGPGSRNMIQKLFQCFFDYSLVHSEADDAGRWDRPPPGAKKAKKPKRGKRKWKPASPPPAPPDTSYLCDEMEAKWRKRSWVAKVFGADAPPKCFVAPPPPPPPAMPSYPPPAPGPDVPRWLRVNQAWEDLMQRDLRRRAVQQTWMASYVLGLVFQPREHVRSAARAGGARTHYEHVSRVTRLHARDENGVSTVGMDPDDVWPAEPIIGMIVRKAKMGEECVKAKLEQRCRRRNEKTLWHERDFELGRGAGHKMLINCTHESGEAEALFRKECYDFSEYIEAADVLRDAYEARTIYLVTDDADMVDLLRTRHREYEWWLLKTGTPFTDAAALEFIRQADALVGLREDLWLPLLLVHARTNAVPPYIMLDRPPLPPEYVRDQDLVNELQTIKDSPQAQAAFASARNTLAMLKSSVYRGHDRYVPHIPEPYCPKGREKECWKLHQERAKHPSPPLPAMPPPVAHTEEEQAELAKEYRAALRSAWPALVLGQRLSQEDKAKRKEMMEEPAKAKRRQQKYLQQVEQAGLPGPVQNVRLLTWSRTSVEADWMQALTPLLAQYEVEVGWIDTGDSGCAEADRSPVPLFEPASQGDLAYEPTRPCVLKRVITKNTTFFEEGLPQRNVWSVRVRAMNSLGWGNLSKAAVVGGRRAPGPARAAPRIEFPSAAALEVVWDAVPDNGAPIYTNRLQVVRERAGADVAAAKGLGRSMRPRAWEQPRDLGRVVREVNTTAKHHVVECLELGFVYLFRVSACNSQGCGPWGPALEYLHIRGQVAVGGVGIGHALQDHSFDQQCKPLPSSVPKHDHDATLASIPEEPERDEAVATDKHLGAEEGLQWEERLLGNGEAVVVDDMAAALEAKHEEDLATGFAATPAPTPMYDIEVQMAKAPRSDWWRPPGAQDYDEAWELANQDPKDLELPQVADPPQIMTGMHEESFNPAVKRPLDPLADAVLHDGEYQRDPLEDWDNMHKRSKELTADFYHDVATNNERHRLKHIMRERSSQERENHKRKHLGRRG